MYGKWRIVKQFISKALAISLNCSLFVQNSKQISRSFTASERMALLTCLQLALRCRMYPAWIRRFADDNSEIWLAFKKFWKFHLFRSTIRLFNVRSQRRELVCHLNILFSYDCLDLLLCRSLPTVPEPTVEWLRFVELSGEKICQAAPAAFISVSRISLRKQIVVPRIRPLQ